MRAPERAQILLTPRLTLLAGQNWWANAGNTGGALAANPVFKALGNRRLVGSVFSSVAANTIQVQFSPDGTNFDNTQTLTADPSNANAYPFDFDLQYPHFRFVVTDSGGGSTVEIEASTFEEGSGPTILGTGPAPSPPSNPTTLPATYRSAFDGIVFTPVGGTILQLANPAASGRVLRVTLQFLSKPSATTRWKSLKQSALTTGGTFTTPTPVPLDSANAATVGVVSLYTDNVGLAAGASLGNLFDVSATAGDTFADNPGSNTNLTQPVVLRAGQSVAWTSDVAVTFCGAIEWSDAAS